MLFDQIFLDTMTLVYVVYVGTINSVDSQGIVGLYVNESDDD